jgi:hypothetical protein
MEPTKEIETVAIQTGPVGEMKTIPLLTIITIILNLFIVVPYGGFLANIELVAIKTLCFDHIAPLQFELIVLVTLAAAQLLLIVSVFLKKAKSKFTFAMAGILVMWLNYFYLLLNTREVIIILTALPFLILSVILVTLLFKKISPS